MSVCVRAGMCVLKINIENILCACDLCMCVFMKYTIVHVIVIGAKFTFMMDRGSVLKLLVFCL